MEVLTDNFSVGYSFADGLVGCLDDACYLNINQWLYNL